MSYNNVGLILQELGDHKQAKEYHQRALTIRLKKRGAEHIDVAMSYNNLGVIHQELGDLEQAKECHQRALSIRLEKLGADHIDVATSYNNLRLIHRDLATLSRLRSVINVLFPLDLRNLAPTILMLQRVTITYV